MTAIIDNSAIKLIYFYKAYLSPRKGYRCAHSVHYGKSSCSSWAIRIIKKHGILAFFPLMKKRSVACSMASEKLKEKKDSENQSEEEYSECPYMNSKGALDCFLWTFICGSST